MVRSACCTRVARFSVVIGYCWLADCSLSRSSVSFIILISRNCCRTGLFASDTLHCVVASSAATRSGSPCATDEAVLVAAGSSPGVGTEDGRDRSPAQLDHLVPPPPRACSSLLYFSPYFGQLASWSPRAEEDCGEASCFVPSGLFLPLFCSSLVFLVLFGSVDRSASFCLHLFGS